MAWRFLDLNHVEMGIRHLRNNLPPGLDQEEEDALKAVVTYFDETYVSETSRQTGVDAQGNPVYRNISPQYPKHTWNVYLSTLSGVSRTNNFCESWNQAFSKLIGYHHPTVWAAIEAFQKDNVMAHLTMEHNEVGDHPTKRVRKSISQLTTQELV